MLPYFKMKCNKLRSQEGSIVSVLVVSAAISIVTYLVAMQLDLNKRFATKRAKDDILTTQIRSGIEAFMVALRIAEINYANQVGNCQAAGSTVSARPFISALKSGSNCQGSQITVFSSGDLQDPVYDNDFLNGTPNASNIGYNNIIKYVSTVCTISEHSTTCAPGTKLLTVTYGLITYEFFLNAVIPNQQRAEFTVKFKDNGTIKTSATRSFAVVEMLQNTAHLESADGRVTQENPNPEDYCPGKSWDNLPLFDIVNKKCNTFGNLGGGTGLAYVKMPYTSQGNFFGFRSNDGSVIDLNATVTQNATSYLVDSTTGALTTGGQQVFPVFDQASLINSDDITVIKNQIYVVKGSGDDAQIGYLYSTGTDVSSNPPMIHPICQLGKMGWGQAYSGIAALSSSDELVGISGTQDKMPYRIAIFYLKSDTGDLFMAIVRSTTKSIDTTALNSNQVINDNGRTFICNVFKDGIVQPVEYKRTLGFDRTVDQPAYYVY